LASENDFISSIDPSSLARILADKDYLRIASKGVKKESHALVMTIRNKRDLKANFHKNILVDFKEADYRRRVAQIGRMYEKKLTYSVVLSRRTMAELEEIKRRGPPKYKGIPTREYVIKRQLYLGLTEKEREQWRKASIAGWLVDYDLCSMVSTLACQLFFGLEFACRSLCAVSCKSFAHKVNKGQVVQHLEVWKTLKKLGGEKSKIECDICANKRNCSFGFDFTALANLYAYSSKIRMLSDYTEEPFHENRAKFRRFVCGVYLHRITNTVIRLDKLLFSIYGNFMWTPFPLNEQIQITKRMTL